MSVTKLRACHRSNRLAFFAGLLAIVSIGMVMTLLPSQSAQARSTPGVHPILLPDLTYMGNATCAGSGCHGEAEPKAQSGQWIGDESNIWAQWDPHANAYKTLSNDDSKAIAGKLEIADATQSARCLTCHAVAAPKAQQGQLFSHKDDAVSCEACHGPAEKWLDPHAKEGWTAQQRQAIGADGMLKQFGLVDTHNLSMRAHTCVACHLQIDKDMVDAGHPALEFELYSYNYYVTDKPGAEYYQHWNEPTDKQIDARLWATGQAAAYEAAVAQLADWKEKGWDTAEAQAMVDLYKAGLDIAEKHFGSRTAVGLADGKYTAETTAAAAKELAALAPTAKNRIHARVIAFGVTALGAATFEARGAQAPDAYWTAYHTATTSEPGDAYVAAVKAMADAL